MLMELICELILTLNPLLCCIEIHVLWVAQSAKPCVSNPEPFWSWVRVPCGTTLKLCIKLSFQFLLALLCCWCLNARCASFTCIFNLCCFCSCGSALLLVLKCLMRCCTCSTCCTCCACCTCSLLYLQFAVLVLLAVPSLWTLLYLF